MHAHARAHVPTDARTHASGQSSKCLQPQKSYTLKLDNDTSLLGMPADNHWALYAVYMDRAYVRNTFVFDLANYGSNGTDGQ